MGWMLLVIVVVILVIAAMGVKSKKKTQDKSVGSQPLDRLSQSAEAGSADPDSKEYSYQKVNVLFSAAERSFLGVLIQAVGENAQVFGKVRVADVITPRKNGSKSDWQKAFNKVSGKHFDYLLCDKSDLSVLCAIELNDRSHNSKVRKERDQFLENACKSADIPLVQVPAKAAYSIAEIQSCISAYLPIAPSHSIDQESSIAALNSGMTQSENEINKTCPKCSSEMLKKVAKKGKNTGNEFWACSAFPKCRYSHEINEE